MKSMNGVLALVICALGWSLGGVFLKYVNVQPFAIAGLRSFVAFIALMALTRSVPKFCVKTENSDGTKCVDKKATLNMWLGGIFYSLTMILYCTANKMTYAANVTLLQYTAPIYVIVLGPLLLKEKNTKLDYVSVAGAIIGMVLFFADSLFASRSGEFSQKILWGNVLAILSGVTYALCTVFIRKVNTEGDASKNSFLLAQLVTFVACLPFIIKNGLPDRTSIIFLVLLGLFQMAIPNILYAVGLKTVRALSAIIITMIEPLMNPVWVAIFVHEIPSVFCIIGGVIILLCIVLREVISARKKKCQ